LFFVGHFDWNACLCRNGADFITDRSISGKKYEETFKDLNSGEHFTVCMSIATPAVRFECNHCKATPTNSLHCKAGQTVCNYKLTDAAKVPKQIQWTPENDYFNPFKEILIQMKQGTFAGSESGLINFFIRYINVHLTYLALNVMYLHPTM
jgi:hypothetical protein